MSRRIKQVTNIKDRDLAIDALELANCGYEVDGDSIFITSGSLRSATINLRTGDIVGDSDYGHSEEQFGLLRQYYAEAQLRADFLKRGTMSDERQVDEEGNVILLAHALVASM